MKKRRAGVAEVTNERLRTIEVTRITRESRAFSTEHVPRQNNQQKLTGA